MKEAGYIEILQGFDMKQASQLFVGFRNTGNSSIKVSGTSRVINQQKTKLDAAYGI